MLDRIEEIDVGGRRFSVRSEQRWVVFEEDGDGADGIGGIVCTPNGFVASVWARPDVRVTRSTLREAVDDLIAAAL